MPYQEYDWDDECNALPWGAIELGREAKDWAGIIIGVDGDRWNVPHGGGVVRTSSAISMSGWLPHWDPQEQGVLTRIAHAYILPHITDSIYRESPIMRYLKHGPPKDPTMPTGLLYARYMHTIPEVGDDGTD